jgi:hypothetical protein
MTVTDEYYQFDLIWHLLNQVIPNAVSQDVEQLLGSAGKVNVGEYFFIWYYDYPSRGSAPVLC